MKNPSTLVAEATVSYIKNAFNHDLDAQSLTLQSTRKDFDGDITLVVFPLTRITRKSPTETANMIGEALKASLPEVDGFNVIQGFLNILFTDYFWWEQIQYLQTLKDFGIIPQRNRQHPILVEFSSPNTNKPLHLGHIRNNLLGASVSRILSANGHKVIKVNLVNDRGIHICKSMLAWQKWGNGETPETSGMKGDHLVGKYYVEFDKHFKAEVAAITEHGIKLEEAEKRAPIMLEVREMLLKWEAGDREIRQLWSKMNGWVYKGFESTYQKMGIEFDKI
ncbi:MAG: arginine--tRNA ligase, partial [Bacteroidetes bacterium HGW-Bacteroidetes-22]